MVGERPGRFDRSTELAKHLRQERGRRRPRSVAREITRGGYPLTAAEYESLEQGTHLPTGAKDFLQAYEHTTPSSTAPDYPAPLTRHIMAKQALAHDTVDDNLGPEAAGWIPTDVELVRKLKLSQSEGE
jgi:hypothetical protein